MQSPVDQKSLMDVFLQFIQQQPHAYGFGSCESPMQALKRALAESPRDSFRIEAAKRRIIFAKSRSPQLTSANQAIQEALIMADQKVRVAPRRLHALLSEIAYSSSLSFSAKRALLELLVPASSEAQPSESQVDKIFTKIINDSSREDAYSSGSHLELAAMAAITTNPGMIWALTERLLHATDRRPPEEHALDIYTEALADAILALGESMPSLDAAETALAVAADRWTGPSHTRGEVKRFVHLGRARIRLLKDDAFNEAIKSAINRVRGHEALCPLKDIMDALCQVPAASSMARLLVDRLVLYSKPPPEDYCSVKKSCINQLKLYGSSSTSSIPDNREADVEEFACFFVPEEVLFMNCNVDHDHYKGGVPSGISSSSVSPHQRETQLQSSVEQYQVDEMLRDAFLEAARRLEDTSLEGSHMHWKTTSLETLVRAILCGFRWTLSMNRELLRLVLVDSKNPPPEPMVDQAFRRTIAAAVEGINRSSDSSRDLVDYLLDAIDKDDYSSTYGPCMKQALIERIVFACKPLPAEFSGRRALADAIAVGVRRLREELSLERPSEEMAAAISRLPCAKSLVKKVLMLAIGVEEERREEPGKKSLEGKDKKKEEKKEAKKEEKKDQKKEEKKDDKIKVEKKPERDRQPCLGPPSRFKVKQKFKVQTKP